MFRPRGSRDEYKRLAASPQARSSRTVTRLECALGRARRRAPRFPAEAVVGATSAPRDLPQAVTLVSSSHATSVVSEPPSAEALIARARGLRFRDPRTGISLATQAYESAQADRDVGACITALRTRANCHARLADLLRAHLDLDRAERLLETAPDDGERGWLLVARADVLARQGAHEDAMTVARHARDVHRDRCDRVGEGESLIVTGAVADRLGDHARALELFQESRQLFEDANDDDGSCTALSNIATIHARLGDHARAIELLEEVLDLSMRFGNRWHESLVRLNLGAAQLAAGNIARALVDTHDCLRLAREIGDRRMEAQALTNVGEIRVREGQPAIACEHLAEALALCMSLGLRPIEIEVHVLLGEAQTALGDLSGAEKHLVSALEIAEAIGSPFLHDIHLALSNLHAKRGDYARALLHHRLFHEAKEATWGAQMHQRVRASLIESELQAAARVERELRLRNTGLHEANEEKTQLLVSLAERTANLERLSLEDGLTGVHNRRYLDSQLALEWERCKRYGHALSVAVLDVDHFKAVNDTFGHAAGDSVLRQLATHLRSHTRRVDIVARYGGEEFVLVFVETPLEVAAALCEQLRLTVAMMDCTPIAVGLRITVSIGVAAMDAATSPAALLASADGRLYDAKLGGRNEVCST